MKAGFNNGPAAARRGEHPYSWLTFANSEGVAKGQPPHRFYRRVLPGRG